MRANVLFLAALPLTVAAAFGANGKAPAPPVIAFHAPGIVISGLTPGGMVTLCSEAKEPQQFKKRFIHRDALVADKLGTGEVQLSLDNVAPVSIWFAVDNASGVFSMAMPPGSPYVPVDVPPNALRRNGKGELFKIDMPLTIFDLLLVRPGEGSWSGTIADGGSKDDDPHPNGRTAADIAKLLPLGNSGPPPEKLKKGDVLIGIDPMSLRYFTVVVGEP